MKKLTEKQAFKLLMEAIEQDCELGQMEYCDEDELELDGPQNSKRYGKSRNLKTVAFIARDVMDFADEVYSAKEEAFEKYEKGSKEIYRHICNSIPIDLFDRLYELTGDGYEGYEEVLEIVQTYCKVFNKAGRRALWLATELTSLIDWYSDIWAGETFKKFMGYIDELYRVSFKLQKELQTITARFKEGKGRIPSENPFRASSTLADRDVMKRYRQIMRAQDGKKNSPPNYKLPSSRSLDSMEVTDNDRFFDNEPFKGAEERTFDDRYKTNFGRLTNYPPQKKGRR